jgi:signal peptidase II
VVAGLLKRAPSLILFVVLIIAVLITDRLTKSLAELTLVVGQPTSFIEGVLDFRLVHNTCAAFGLLEGAATVLGIIALVVVVVSFLYLMFAPRSTALGVVGLALICAGAAGNAIDRLLFSSVTDFLNFLFVDFPVFNVADCSISVGVVLFIISLFFGGKGSAS